MSQEKKSMYIGTRLSILMFLPCCVCGAWFVQGREADMLPGWQTYWLIPCIAAAVIVVVFTLLLKAKEQGAENAG